MKVLSRLNEMVYMIYIASSFARKGLQNWVGGEGGTKIIVGKNEERALTQMITDTVTHLSSFSLWWSLHIHLVMESHTLI